MSESYVCVCVCVCVCTCVCVTPQSSGDESAVLWLDQIQAAIHTANQEEQEALRRNSDLCFSFVLFPLCQSQHHDYSVTRVDNTCLVTSYPCYPMLFLHVIVKHAFTDHGLTCQLAVLYYILDVKFFKPPSSRWGIAYRKNTETSKGRTFLWLFQTTG